MRPFALEPGMLNMQGVFYPKGHMFVMFPTEQEARDAAVLLERNGVGRDEVSLLAPAEILDKIGGTAGIREEGMPSVGTEAATVRHFADLAREGHHALLVHAPSAAQTQRLMSLLKDAHVSYAQKYRFLVIEDLVSDDMH